MSLPCITAIRTSSRDLANIWMLAVEITVLSPRITNASDWMLTLSCKLDVASTLETLKCWNTV